MPKFSLALVLAFAPTLLSQNGYITTVAGNGTTGTSGTGGLATNASFSGGMISVDSLNNIYIADRANNRVVRVDAATRILTLVAGNGIAASTGDGGPAVQASLNSPAAVVRDSSGSLYISESGGNRVRRVDAATGIITTYAGTGAGGWSGDGGPATSGTFSLPMGLAFDPAGSLYIADAANFRVRRVDASTGILSTVAGTGVNAHSPDGTAAISASLAVPMAVSFDLQGNLLITEVFANTIRRVTAGVLTTLAGNGGTTFNGDGEAATSAALGTFASNVTADPAGNLYFADGTGRVRRVDAVTGAIISVAGSGAGAHGQTSSAAGGGGGTTTCPGNLGDNGPATLATLDGVAGVAFTSTGQLLMSDSIDCRVRGVPLPSPLLYTSSSLTLSATTLTATVSPIGGSTIPTGTVQFMQYATIGPPVALVSATLSNGTATVNTLGLPAGSYQVMAVYTGDSTYNGSGSIAVPVTGSGLATPNFGATVPNPVLVSTPVTIPITITGSRGAATGSINLYEGSILLTTLPLVNGIASFTYSSGVTGTHQITVQYPGDANYGANSWTFSVTVLSPSTVALSGSGSPSTYGQSVTFTATVSPQSATGTVQFLDGGAILGSASVSLGTAQFTVSTLTGGSHTVTANYRGDSFTSVSTSAPLIQTISPATPVITISSTANPTTVGTFVLFNMSMTPPSPGAMLSILDGQTVLATVPTSSTGGASYSTTALTAGYHSMTASWAGDANVIAGVSAVLSEQIQSPTTTSVIATGPVTYGQSVTVTATVSPSTASGTVQFNDGGSGLGTVPLSSGVASVTYVPSSAGTHQVVATFLDSNNIYIPSNGSVTLNVAKATPAITVTTSPNPSNVGQLVTLTATISAGPNGDSVNFFDGSTLLGAGTLTSGTAVIYKIFQSSGSHSITASYGGNNNFAAATSPVVTQVVNKAASTTAVSASSGTISFGQSVTLTASVSPASATGTVQFLDGGTVIGAPLLNGGSTTLVVANLATGTHSITASYGGDGATLASTSSAISVVVVKVATSIVLTSSLNPSLNGQAVTFTASVSPSSAATGTVQFLDGATAIGAVALSNGMAALTISKLAAGSHSLTAVYGGDANYNRATSATLTQSVLVATTTTLTANRSALEVGDPLRLTADVWPGGATGRVNFLDGTTLLGTVPLSDGSAMLRVSNLKAGTHTITAAYTGGAKYASSTSPAVTITVH